MRILVIENQEEAKELIEYRLKKEEHEVLGTTSGLTGLKIAKKILPELILLNLDLEDSNGLTLCQMIRENREKYGDPLIMIITSGTSSDEVLKGLKAGADDYIKKPFNEEELILKIGNYARRMAPHMDKITEYKGLIVDHQTRKIKENDNIVCLSPKEYDLFLYMVKNKNKLLTRSKLMIDVWEREFIYGERTIDVCIKRLRSKLSNIKADIKTVSGFGYMLEE